MKRFFGQTCWGVEKRYKLVMLERINRRTTCSLKKNCAAKKMTAKCHKAPVVVCVYSTISATFKIEPQILKKEQKKVHFAQYTTKHACDVSLNFYPRFSRNESRFSKLGLKLPFFSTTTFA